MEDGRSLYSLLACPFIYGGVVGDFAVAAGLRLGSEQFNIRQCNPISARYYPVGDTNADLQLLNKIMPQDDSLTRRSYCGNTIDTTSYPEKTMAGAMRDLR